MVRPTKRPPGGVPIPPGPATPTPSYVVVAENWYKDWRATVDGTPTPVYRGDQSLITVGVPAGARQVELAFEAADYRTGRMVTQLSLLVLVVGLVVAPLARRRRGRGARARP